MLAVKTTPAMRRAGCGALGGHALFRAQLRAGGVARTAVAPVNAAAVGAQQAARDLGGFWRLQAEDLAEL